MLGLCNVNSFQELNHSLRKQQGTRKHESSADARHTPRNSSPLLSSTFLRKSFSGRSSTQAISHAIRTDKRPSVQLSSAWVAQTQLRANVKIHAHALTSTCQVVAHNCHRNKNERHIALHYSHHTSLYSQSHCHAAVTLSAQLFNNRDLITSSTSAQLHSCSSQPLQVLPTMACSAQPHYRTARS